MEDDEEVDLTSTFKSKNQRRNKTKEQSSSKDISNRDSVDLDNIEDLYDRPKVPPVRYIPDDIKAQNTSYQEDEERSYKDEHSKTRSKIRKHEELEDDNGDTYYMIWDSQGYQFDLKFKRGHIMNEFSSEPQIQKHIVSKSIYWSNRINQKIKRIESYWNSVSHGNFKKTY